jgi:hypothetical protein
MVGVNISHKCWPCLRPPQPAPSPAFPGWITSVGSALATQPHDRRRLSRLQLQLTDQGSDVLDRLNGLELAFQVCHLSALQA